MFFVVTSDFIDVAVYDGTIFGVAFDNVLAGVSTSKFAEAQYLSEGLMRSQMRIFGDEHAVVGVDDSGGHRVVAFCRYDIYDLFDHFDHNVLGVLRQNRYFQQNGRFTVSSMSRNVENADYRISTTPHTVTAPL